MSKWSIFGTVAGWKYLGVVKAQDREDANQAARKMIEQEEQQVKLCPECAKQLNDLRFIDITSEYLEEG